MASKPSQPYSLDLQFRGHIQGLTYLDSSSKPLCHYFGGVPYALPPLGPFRFQKPRQLPPCYRYGTKRNPAVFTGGCGVCPQPGVNEKEWDEDCLQCNAWVPVGEVPEGGWPVMVYIHGGFLQYGTPNALDLRSFLSSSPIKCIVVAPSYRLNIFGFLASSTLPQSSYSPNLGFWDQRLALEWTFQNINYFGGNASNITVAGYSAGSHSVFHQLRFDICVVPKDKGIIKRVMMLSNGPGLQPKSLPEIQQQYIQLLSALRIPHTLSPTEQLTRLRSISPKTLLAATRKMALHQFRGVTDSSFIHPNLWTDLTFGRFAHRVLARNIPILLGECSDEHFVYGNYHPPSSSFSSMSTRLTADYPTSSVSRIMCTYFPLRTLPVAKYPTWQSAFGHIYADIQIHSLLRGFAHTLYAHGAGKLVHRYRIEWRAKSVDKRYPKAWGVTHTSDLAIWFFEGLEESEKKVVREFVGPVKGFIEGGGMDGWTTNGERGLRVLKSDGRVVVQEDSGWDEGMDVWRKVIVGEEKGEKAKL